MGISFSSSLFGLAGSLILGFLDLQSSQAQNRFYTELEDWLSTTVYDQAVEPGAAPAVGMTGEVRTAIDRLRDVINEAGTSKTASAAMSNLAEAIQGLVHHMRTEQQMIRDWVDAQAEQQREIKKLLEIVARENDVPKTEPIRISLANGARPHPPRRQRHELLAGLRRRAVDVGARHHFPAHGLRGGAVLSAAGSRRQGHRARPAKIADRRS